MDLPDDLMVFEVMEDADDGSVILVPRPHPDLEKPWGCDHDGSVNEGWRRRCVYCGRWREDVE